MTKSEIRAITGNSNAGKATDFIRVSAHVGSFTSSEIRTHPESTGGDASQVLSSQLIKKLAEYQKSMFDGAAKPDVKITLNDGGGGTINFEGYSSQPGINTGMGNVGVVVNAVHAESLVDGLRLDIYIDNGTDKLTPEPSAEISIAKRIAFVTKRMIQLWEEQRDKEAADAEITDRIHSQNEKCLKVWYAILSASEETTQMKSLSGLSEAIEIDSRINGHIRQVLSAQRPSFMSTIQALCGVFQMLFIPGVQGATGKLVMLAQLLDSPEDKSLTGDNVSLSLGSRQSSPTGQVVVLGLGGSLVQSADDRDVFGVPPSLTNNVLVKYPENIVAGRSSLSVPVPSWLGSLQSSALASAALVEPAGLRVSQVQKAAEEQIEVTQAIQSGALSDVCKEYARNIFVDAALGSCRATLNSVLDLTWECGKVYRVKMKEGGALLSGQLVSVVHTAQGLQNSPSANTQLTFGLVEVDGFKLPGR